MIRKAIAIDSVAVEKIERENFNDYWTKDMLNQTLVQNHTIFLILEIDGVIVGYIIGARVADEGEIYRIAIKNEYKRKGYAKELIDEFFNCFNEDDHIFLEVRESNMIAQNLYLKKGFHNCGIRPNYYEGTENAILMEKVV